MEGGGHDEEVASSKKNEFKTRVQKSIPYLWPKWRQNGQNRYPIYDQNGWKPLPFGAAHTYIAHIREYPPGVTSKCDLFDMLCNLAYVKNESRSTRAALSRLMDAVNGETCQSSTAIWGK